jgi:chromosome segregation ATPase
MKTILPLILFIITLSSCGNSAKQIADQQAREKFVADSVAQAIQAAATAKQEFENQKLELQKSIATLGQEEYKLQQANAQAKASLAAANDNLSSAYDFHLLRSSAERQADIQSASLKVNELKQDIVNLQQQYVDIQNKLETAKSKLTSMQ